MFGMLSEDDEIVKDRLKTCEECDRFMKILSMCKECGCVVRFKVLLQVSDCPLKKWKEAI